MRFEPSLEEGVLVVRYKRFLADVILASGATVTMHCANTGAMLGCSDPGSRVWYSTSANPRRKYQYSLELVETACGELACVNTARANRLVEEGLVGGAIDCVDVRGGFRREARIPGDTGRFDFATDDTVIEVKSVTLARGDVGAFPDAVSERATRHVEALVKCRHAGLRAVLLFCAPHSGIRTVTVADDIDPVYGASVRRAQAAGVEVIAYGCSVSPFALAIDEPLNVVL